MMTLPSTCKAIRAASTASGCKWTRLSPPLAAIAARHQKSVRFFASADTTSARQRPERPRRSLFSVPGADARKIQKAQTLGADAVVLDLEDGVAWDKKDQARDLVRQTLSDTSVSFGQSELCVRINALDASKNNEMAMRDLQAVLESPTTRLQAVVIPKVETPEDVHWVNEVINHNKHGDGSDIRIITAVESAVGMLNLRDIAATVESAPLDALVFASEDYCADLEAIRTTEATELLWARSILVTTAKAHGLQAIDMVHIQFRDLDGLAVECQRGRELGFTGKQAIHPIQVDPIHKAFAPSAKDVDLAGRMIEAYTDTTAQGKGACVVEGVVVDAPVYKWAVKILKRAETAGMLNSHK